MDKLELDERVMRLERRVAIQSVLLALTGAGALLAGILMTARMAVSHAEDFGPATPAPMAMQPPAPTIAPEMRAPGGMAHLDAQLRKLRDLKVQGLIDAGEFEAKKAGLLNVVLHPGEFGEDVMAAKALKDESILTDTEYVALKKKILGIDR